ncbi:lycopene cyclase family protein [Lichenihabitans psoromatis]|uniref:lycopene cyclase family protein n=1 Tax=Lichenihabitans psoromatis TaxID=2528642 RepID=UPI0010364B17|nr:lycopene cyclase family protein [Lichenihabitans psoromatis]
MTPACTTTSSMSPASQRHAMQGDFDLVILGGGCAGLSLARRLTALGRQAPRTLVLERRTAYADDRTWCFWDDGSMGLNHLVRHSWATMRVKTEDAAVLVECGDAPYRMLGAAAFYAEALGAIEASDRVEIALGSEISAEPRKTGEVWSLETATGSVTAHRIVDTRPFRRPVRGGATLWQSFYGREIDCEAGVFNPACVDLMDFAPVEKGRIQFTYVLPVSTRRALIETTVFDADPWDRADLRADLDEAVADRVGGQSFTIVREEHGVLPMGTPRVSRLQDPTFIHAGLDAGGARPSSGYAFRRIQAWAQACASAIATGKPLVGHAEDPLMLRAMDALFLSVMRSRPDVAPGLFVALFGKADTRRLIRFMSDGGNLIDYTSVALALPAWLFLGQIPRAFNQAALGHRT